MIHNLDIKKYNYKIDSKNLFRLFINNKNYIKLQVVILKYNQKNLFYHQIKLKNNKKSLNFKHKFIKIVNRLITKKIINSN